MCTITLSLAKRGEAIPGPYSSLTCFAGVWVRPGAVPERGEIEGHRHRRARWTFHSGQRPLHSGRYGPCSGHSGEARDRLWRSGSRPSRFPHHSGKRCVDPKSGPDFGPDYAAASRAPLLPSPAAAAVAVPSYGLAVDSPHRFQLTRRARPPLAAAARAAGSRQRLAGCRIGEYRTSGV